MEAQTNETHGRGQQQQLSADCAQPAQPANRNQPLYNISHTSQCLLTHDMKSVTDHQQQQRGRHSPPNPIKSGLTQHTYPRACQRRQASGQQPHTQLLTSYTNCLLVTLEHKHTPAIPNTQESYSSTVWLHTASTKGSSPVSSTAVHLTFFLAT